MAFFGSIRLEKLLNMGFPEECQNLGKKHVKLFIFSKVAGFQPSILLRVKLGTMIFQYLREIWKLPLRRVLQSRSSFNLWYFIRNYLTILTKSLKNSRENSILVKLLHCLQIGNFTKIWTRHWYFSRILLTFLKELLCRTSLGDCFLKSENTYFAEYLSVTTSETRD